MRTWFWTLLLLIVAVALAVLLRTHAGNVLVLVWPYRIEMSLTLAVLLVLGGFVALYVVLRLLAWLLAVPERMRSWRGRRAQARDHELLERGWISLLEGRFVQAEKDLTKLLGQTRVKDRRVLAALSAARAAQGLGEYGRRDIMLTQAREQSVGNPGLIEATATVTADLLLDQGRPQEALDVLQPIQTGGPRHLHTLQLLLRAERSLGHHDRVFVLARSLFRRSALTRDEAEQLIQTSGAARLRGVAGNDEAWRAIWKDMKAEERSLPDIALAGATAFEAAGEGDEAARILETAIARRFAPGLVAAYARCDASQVPRRLEKAEGWLQQRPHDADLLTALGLLCLNGQLWGSAERYLERSLRVRADPTTHALLGSLYDRLDRPEDAVRQWRLATAAGMALPILASDTFLPAADMRQDPRRLDADGAFMGEMSDGISSGAEMPDTGVATASAPEVSVSHLAPSNKTASEAVRPSPLTAGAAHPPVDYAMAPETAERNQHRPPPDALIPLANATDIDEYFDSAPIPYPRIEDDEDDEAKDAPGKSEPGGDAPRSPERKD
jgi:HemY protein